MVWFDYVLETYHGDAVVSEPSSPSSSSSDGSPRAPRSIDPKRVLTEDEAIDLYFYMKEVCKEGFYDHCLLNENEFNSFSLQEFINTRRHSHTIEDVDHFKHQWIPTYRNYLEIMLEYVNRQLRFMGKKVAIPRKLFYRFVYTYSDKFVSHS